MIKLTSKGDFSKVTKFFEQMTKAAEVDVLEQYAHQGLSALSAATPVRTGKTAASWSYQIKRYSGGAKITFYNSNTNDGVNIAIILQYGHATGNGGWVQGRDYINPAIQPVFDQIAEAAWKEVTKA